MPSLLNTSRPPVFCPGCGHERITRMLDKATQSMGLEGNQVVLVSDIGCSGLFDTFFNTHAFHGLHGRALTYATGLKLARPELTVIVTMGDGGMGIGGAHFLAACRRNVDITLLILNNFNYGMTGGQYSATTPSDARVASGFLNQLEPPLDPAALACTAGAPYVTRCSAYREDLAEELARAIRYDGFSVVEMWDVCTGRYTRRNKLSPKRIAENLSRLPPLEGPVAANARCEYGRRYREAAAAQKRVEAPAGIEKRFDPPAPGRHEVIFLGAAGQRIVTAGEILCLAGISAGLNASQKNDYPITVLRGHSVSEVILSDTEIGFAGIETPSVVVALAPEGVQRRAALLAKLPGEALLIKAKGVDLPACHCKVMAPDFKGQKIAPQDWALAALVLLARQNQVLSMDMLQAALAKRFTGEVLETARALVGRVEAGFDV